MSKIAFMFPGQGSFEPGMGRDIADAHPEAMAVYERGQRGVRPRPPAPLLPGHGRGADADRAAAAGARRHEPRDQRGAARARHHARTTSSGHSVGEFSALGAAELDGRQRGDRARARARPRDGRGRERAPRLDGRDPRPGRRGRRGPLPQDLERVAGELQLPRPARHLGRDRRRRRGLLGGAARGRAPRDPAQASPARSTRRSSSAPPSACGRRSTRSTSRRRPRSSSRR